MAAHLIAIRRPRVDGAGTLLAAIVASAMLGCALCGNAVAQAVTDPTQPPASLAPLRAADADTAPPPPAEHTVRMIVRGPGEIRSALLGDTLVRAGDRARWNGEDVRVVAVNDASVVIARGSKRETIELLPEAAHAVRCNRTRNPSAPCQAILEGAR